MKCLLDTHTVIWFAENSPQLSTLAANTILDIRNTLYVSIASAWEVAIKCSIGKLELDGGVESFLSIISANGFMLLPIEAEHLLCLQSLPFQHRDPFDRLLVATATIEGLTMITADKNITRHRIPIVW